MDEREFQRMKSIAVDWIESFLGANGFGDDFTSEEVDEWADDLLETFGLPA